MMLYGFNCAGRVVPHCEAGGPSDNIEDLGVKDPMDAVIDTGIACGMTEDEAICWGAVYHAADILMALPKLHPMDAEEVARAIHILQDKLLARPAYRKYLELTKCNATGD